MGSGHILVYAFDVFMQLYEAEGETSRYAAEHILSENLYGLDIDQRAYQLTYFALMMKARQYNRRILSKKISPNVYAIPESKNFNKEDLQLLTSDLSNNSKALQDIETLVDGFEHGKDLGSLIEFKGIDFDNLRSTVISGDVSFIDDYLSNLIQVGELLQESYEIIITNPPYMGSSGFNQQLKDYATKNYPNSKSDLCTMFIERWNKSTTNFGYNSMVTMQSWMFLSSYENMRKNILANYVISSLMHMENMVMGIAFGTAVTIFYKNVLNNFKGTYHQIKTSDVIDTIPTKVPIEGNRFNQVSQNQFNKIPGSPISYWVSDNIINAFETGSKMGDVVSAKVGLQTGSNDIFLRQWWEVKIDNIKFDATSIADSVNSGKKWFPYNKGGAFRRWYGNYDYVVNWENDGQEIRNFVDNKGKLRSRPQNTDYYFQEAITWSDVTSGNFSMRYREQGSIFDSTGHSAFTDSKGDKFYMLGVLNSPVGNYIFKILNPTIHMHIGYVSLFPTLFNHIQKDDIINTVEECISLAKSDWLASENSWHTFSKHPLI